MKTCSVNSPAAQFSERALQVQRTLQSSLTMSLKKEAEMKSKWQASPGEILHQGLHMSHHQATVPGKLNFLTLPEDDIVEETKRKT